MSRRKTTNPKLIAANDQMQAAIEAFDRRYRRMKRAFNTLDKTRSTILRLARRIAKLEEEDNPPRRRKADDQADDLGSGNGENSL